jgi:hypothetical protein
MYRLPQVGVIAQDLLKERLLKAGYKQSKIILGYWIHQWQPTSFTIVIDDLCIEYIGKDYAQHLINTLKQNYRIEVDWDGNRYLGITLDWDYKKRKAHLSMPSYIDKELARFGHKIPAQPQNQPHRHAILT